MQKNASEPYQLGEPLSQKNINDRLHFLKLPTISREQFDLLAKTEPADRLTRALNLAVTDNGARNYLAGILQKIGVNVPSREALNAQAGQQEAPPHGFGQQSAPRQNSGQRSTSPRHNDRSPAPSPSGSQNSQQQPQATNGPRDENISHHVYGGKAALCFETDMTRGGEDGKNSIFTISLDGAPSIGTRKYDWKNKTRIQMTRAELPIVTAVLLGFLPRCEFKNHGPQSDKGFSIEDQGDKLFIKIFAKETPVKAVPVTPEDAFEVAKLFMRQLRKNAPWLSGQDVMNLIKTVIGNRMVRRN